MSNVTKVPMETGSVQASRILRGHFVDDCWDSPATAKRINAAAPHNINQGAHAMVGSWRKSLRVESNRMAEYGVRSSE